MCTNICNIYIYVLAKNARKNTLRSGRACGILCAIFLFFSGVAEFGRPHHLCPMAPWQLQVIALAAVLFWDVLRQSLSYITSVSDTNIIYVR